MGAPLFGGGGGVGCHPGIYRRKPGRCRQAAGRSREAARGSRERTRRKGEVKEKILDYGFVPGNRHITFGSFATNRATERSGEKRYKTQPSLERDQQGAGP